MEGYRSIILRTGNGIQFYNYSQAEREGGGCWEYFHQEYLLSKFKFDLYSKNYSVISCAVDVPFLGQILR